MKMHPKPMSRHTRHVEPVKQRIVYDTGHEEPLHVAFTFANGSTQRLTMTREEASKHAHDILAILRVSAG
jgi:hypothetical protein